VIVGAMVSMDGVMQAPGGPEEDPTGGFKFGGWVAPFADVDQVMGEELGKLFGQPFDLLLGRRTYDIFAAYWPFAEGGSYDDIANVFNRVRKYVATRKGANLTWKGSVELRDGATDVAELKREDGPALVTQGSTELVHSLLAAGLVDEIRTFTSARASASSPTTANPAPSSLPIAPSRQMASSTRLTCAMAKCRPPPSAARGNPRRLSSRAVRS
jgi:dihydrofolate reductase